MKGAEPQLELFPPPPLDTSADAALAARRPKCLRIGTSSWSFPGWAGIVYRGQPTQEALIARGLEEYARHPLFNTVGIDRSHYAPLSVDELAGYAKQLPKGYRCVTKVWNAVTSLVDPRTRAPNPHFLDARFFRDAVLAPSDAAFHEHQGPFVFQFLPLSPSELPNPNQFIFKLERFLAQLPKHFEYAVEVRNAELLTPSYFYALARHHVAHVFTHWERMPPLGKQLDLAGSLTANFVVARLNIPPGVGYEQAREAYAPFNRIHDVDLVMRADIERLIRTCAATGRTVWVTVNNKVEGSSPLTVRAILERVADADKAGTLADS